MTLKRWGNLSSRQISQEMVERFVLERAKVSPFTANKEIRYLRSVFNFARRRKLVADNPLVGINFLPTERRIKHVPSPGDIDKVIALADQNTQDYLWVIRETMGRMSEINRLTWDDVKLSERYVILYTRKKKGGHLSPRKVPMTQKLFDVLDRRYSERDPSKSWVFWLSTSAARPMRSASAPFRIGRSL